MAEKKEEKSSGQKRGNAGAAFKGKFRDKMEEEASKEAVNAFRAWRQRSINGVLPIGVSRVGKTTLLDKFGADCPELFLDFNRTLKTKVENYRLRQDFLEQCSGIEFYKRIDPPGEIPGDWAKAYFDYNPRVLVVLVDDRPADVQADALRKFLAAIAQGPTKWQRTKTVLNWRWGNLAGILFVVNKVDRLSNECSKDVDEAYKGVLADLRSTLGAPIRTFRTSLTKDAEGTQRLFQSVVETFGRK
jgi:hypothetical protein